MDVWVLRPAFTDVQPFNDDALIRYKIMTQYMPKNAVINVALAPTEITVPDNVGQNVSVKRTTATIDPEDGSIYWASFNKSDLAVDTYNVWCQLNTGYWVKTDQQFTVSNSDNNTP